MAQQPPRDLQQIAAEFTAAAVDVDGRRYPYRLLEPLPPRLEPVPVVLFLHGAGERGDDNVSQLHWLPEQLVKHEWRQRWPCYVVAVQCPEGERWVEAPWGEARSARMHERPSRALRAAQVALQEVLERDDVDPARVYVTGLSMGGYGCWELLARDPDLFAAGMPICGGGDVEAVRRLCGLPIRFFHGDADRVVPVARSRIMADAMRELGLPVSYDELPGVGHGSWRVAYGPDGGLAWLFAQDQRQQLRGAFAELAVVPRPVSIARRQGSWRLREGSRWHVAAALTGMVTCLFDSLAERSSLQPSLASGEPVRAGDVVLAIDGAQAGVQIDVDTAVTVTAADARTMRHGLAALRQALGASGAAALPCGRIVLGAPAALTVTVASVEEPWGAEALGALLHECWLAGVDRLRFEPVGDGGAVAADEVWTAFASDAGRLGIELLADAPDLPVHARLGPGDAIADVLAMPIASGPLHAVLAASSPQQALQLAATRLPALRERAAHADRPVHVSSFLSRLGRRWR